MGAHRRALIVAAASLCWVLPLACGADEPEPLDVSPVGTPTAPPDTDGTSPGGTPGDDFQIVYPDIEGTIEEDPNPPPPDVPVDLPTCPPDCP